MKRKDRHASIKRLTFCAMLVALGVIFLGIGALIEVLDIYMAVIASICVIIPMIEYGKGTPWMVYGAISVLSLLLLPNKFPAALFALFAGFYPILKEKFEKLNKVICWILKEAVFNVSLAAMAIATYFLTTTGDNTLFTSPLFIAVAVVAAELVFVLYDVALTRLISFYIIKLRHRFKF